MMELFSETLQQCNVLTTKFYNMITITNNTELAKFCTDNSLTMFADGGHAWLRVPLSVLNIMGIADKVSRYSYIRDNNVYLEEDCDLTLFIDSLGITSDTIGKQMMECFWRVVPECYADNSPVRNYQHYKVN